MSAAWGVLATRLAKAERRVQAVAAETDNVPDGMVSVLMFGIAVHLGGYPTPTHPRSILEADDVPIALERALGFTDAAERRLTAVLRDDDWLRRFVEASGRLFVYVGLDANASMIADSTLVAFAKMLDRIESLRACWGDVPGWPASHPWGRVEDDLDKWIRASGLSPEAIRAEARVVAPRNTAPPLDQAGSGSRASS